PSPASRPRCASSRRSSPCTRLPSRPRHGRPSLRAMTDSSAGSGGGGGGSSGRPSRGSGSFTVHLAEELEVYFNEVAHGRPVGVDPESIRANYEHGFLEVRLTKVPVRSSGTQSVKVE